MSGLKLFSAMLAALWLSSCALPEASPTCLDIAETGADGRAIRAAPLPAVASGGKELCEGIALIRDQRGEVARAMLARALEALPATDSWLAQGALAWSLTLDKQNDEALQLWDPAIAGAVRTGNRKREYSFRMVRGTLYARAEQYAPSLADFTAAYALSNEPRPQAQAAYSVLGLAVTTNNLDLARDWYPKVMQTAAAAKDVATQSKAAEFYAQMLEEAGQPDEAAKVYDNAVTAARATGSKEMQAEMLEYQGQARFTAGDYRGGERAYGEAAELARQAGQTEFAAQLDASLRARLMRYESGDACGVFLDAGKPEIAERTVTDVPQERRSWALQACEIRVFIKKNDPGRARQRLEGLIQKTGTGAQCGELRALAVQIGMTVDAAPQLSSSSSYPNSPPVLNAPPVYDGRCRL